VTERVKSGALYQDIVAAPEDKIAEIVEGYLYLSPRPSLRHSNAGSVLGANLNSPFHQGRRGPGGWWILDEPELHLHGDVLVPDLAGWRRERLPELPNPESPGVELAPDWVCEILSPSTEKFDRLEKLPRYALATVAQLWLVDPIKRRLEVYGRVDLQWVLLEEYSGSATVVAPPFEAVPIELNPLWV
jgi:Uma2 family endonuclease